MLHDENTESKLVFSKLQMRRSVPLIQFSVVVNQDLTWSLFVYGVEPSQHNIPATETPILLNSASCVNYLLQHLAKMSIYQGNPDEKFHKLVPS